jgi:hypothetical protein
MLFSSIYTLFFDIGIKTALQTSINGCSLVINNLLNYSSNYPNIQKWLDESDIKWTIEIMEKFIHDLTLNNKEDVQNKELLVVDKCLDGLKEVLLKLENELKEIENGIRYHESKYLNKWRNIYIDEYINRANNHIKILNNRFELFIKIINSRDVKK